LNNSHSSLQIDLDSDEDHFIKTPNMNNDLKERFIKASNIKNDGHKKHKKRRNTNQKKMKYSHQKTHHTNFNRTEKAG
jgi:hypothetical protein